jgi:thiamine biosynthesis lipoprotein
MTRRPYGWLGEFSAMASPCEVLVVGLSGRDAEHLTRAVASEAERIERKFSRYRKDNIVDRINRSRSRPIAVDAETARLLDYADQLYRLSSGRFDITSGTLRRAWRFDGGTHIPRPDEVAELMRLVGWHRVDWHPPRLRMPPGMEIDFGGIGKEYAVDRAAMIAAEIHGNCLINFGGDLVARGGGIDDGGWTIGIEGITANRVPARRIRLERGALATSGDAHRFVIRDGKRLGHILDPRTGWPVEGAPRSVTVAAPTCTEAGMLATFAMLHGENAESFLDREGARYWCLR